jgi:hypothetical protein
MRKVLSSGSLVQTIKNRNIAVDWPADLKVAFLGLTSGPPKNRKAAFEKLRAILKPKNRKKHNGLAVGPDHGDFENLATTVLRTPSNI